MEYEHNNWEDRSGSHGMASVTVDDARRHYEQTISSNLNKIGDIGVVTDKDGRNRVFGIEVPKAMKPVLELTIANVLPYLTRHGSEAVYKKSAQFATKLKAPEGRAHEIALVAENVFRWGLIGAKPISDVVSATNLYAQQRKELYKEFAPVMAATKANYKNNEVIKVAYDGLHHDMMSNMRLVMADLPTLVPQVIFGLQDQAELRDKRNKAFSKEKGDVIETAETALKSKSDQYFERIKEKVEFNTRLEQTLNESRQRFIDQGLDAKRLGHDGKTLSAEDLGHIFDSEIKSSLKWDLQNELRAEADARHRKQDEDTRHHDKKYDDKNSGLMQVVIPVASSISQIFKAGIDESAQQRRKHVNSWQMIKNLKQEMDQQCAERAAKFNGTDYDCGRDFSAPNPDDIYVPGIGPKAGQSVRLKDYIIDVFQQHERDRLGEGDKYDASGRLIEPLGPALVARLSPAVDKIAEYIADGRLDAYALVNLVGENQIIVHRQGGAKSFAAEEQAQAAIDNLLGVMSSRETIKPDEFFANFADPKLIQAELKKNLEHMKGEERALFAALFPDDILEQSGLKKSEIGALRKEAHEHMQDIVAVSVLDLAEKNPEKLKKLGLSEQDVSSISDLADKIRTGDNKSLEMAVDGRDKSIISAVRTAQLHELTENPEEGKSFWSRRVKEAGSLREKIKGLIQKSPKEGQTESTEASAETRHTERHEFMGPAEQPEKGPESFVEKLGGEGAVTARDRETSRRNTSNDPNNMLAV